VTPLTETANGSALAAYEAFAPYYDRYTADHGHDDWMADVDAILRQHGVVGNRLLDVACGTGKSFMPMLDRGWTVTACDLSPAMVERARAKLGRRGEVRVADMRDLPWQGRFDAATCVDDSINYLLSLADVVAAMRSIREALAPGGLVVFDVNSLGTYRGAFADELSFDTDGTTFRWRGEGSRFMPPGELVAAATEVLAEDGSVTASARHVQRHYSIEQLRLACAEAGLRCLDFWGQVTDVGLVRAPDEELSSKILCLAARPRDPRGRRGLVAVG
jgi:SAM-dependent methyltransferase